MTGQGTAKSNLGDSQASERQQDEELRKTKQAEEHNLSKGLEAEEEQQEEQRRAEERDEQQDLNQGGLDTGTHDSTRHGVDWGPSYQVRGGTNRKRGRRREPDKPSK